MSEFLLLGFLETVLVQITTCPFCIYSCPFLFSPLLLPSIFLPFHSSPISVLPSLHPTSTQTPKPFFG